MCLVIQPLRPICPLLQLFRLCHCRRRVHSRQDLPFEKGWVSINTSGTTICLEGGRSGRGWSVLGATFYFVLYFRHCVHIRLEATFWKEWVGHNPAGNHHMPSRQEERMWVDCMWRRHSMHTMWDEKRRCRISWQNFLSSITYWAPSSTTLWSGSLGRRLSWSWQHLLAHITWPIDHSSHCVCTHTILQMIPVYF